MPSLPSRASGRTKLLAVLVPVLVLALAAVSLVIVRPGPIAGWWGSGDRSPAIIELGEPTPPPVLANVPDNAPMPTPAGIRAAIDALVTGSALGSEVNVSVLDALTGESLYVRGGDVPTVPASTTKLATAVTVLATRGPAYRITTRVVAGAEPGEVVIIGAGDPTLAVNGTGSYPGAGRLDRLAEQVKQALGGTVPTKVTVDSSLYSGPTYEPGWDADIPTGGYGAAMTALMTDGARLDPKKSTKGAARTPVPDLAAGKSFAKLLGLPAAQVKAVSRGTAPPANGSTAPPTAGTGPIEPGTELGRVQSPPIIRMVDFMLTDSDNVVAEALARQVALSRGQPASFVGGAAAMDVVLAELGLPADQSDLADGSGLSRSNRVTPELLSRLLVMVANGQHPELTGLVNGLPVAGWSGTLDDRFGVAASRMGAGVVRAKTGTLSGVHAFSGLLTTADGRLLAFTVLANKVPVGSDQAQPILDRLAATLAACGCR
nr:D-alanyl-D-alanine carboxypeptidase/D-alanyl-D-alanine-endopeptidase [Micromonospora polyrhachis]